MTGTLILDPLIPMVVFYVVAGLVTAAIGLAIWRRLPGWCLRGLAGLALLAALINPAIQQEDREPLSDIVMLVVDESASQRIGDRPAQNAAALANIEAQVARQPNTELRSISIAEV